MSDRLANARLQFIDDELMRLPMIADQVFDATWRTLTDSVPGLNPAERAIVAELLQAGPAHRQRLVERFSQTVRQQVKAELEGRSAPAASGPAAGSSAFGGLALLDEAEIAADVETSRAIEAIRSSAEHELREMAAFASALAGDPDVSRDHNLFSPERYAQALWEAAQALPLGRAYQVRLMRHAVLPLAQVLRKSYAGACARLEAQGIEPATHRTLILPGGKRSTRPSQSLRGDWEQPMYELRQTLPTALDIAPAADSRQLPLEAVIADTDAALRRLPADATPTMHAQLLESQRAKLVHHARTALDQQHIELLSRLFEAMLSDSRVARDIRSVLARMQPSALRLVLREAQALDDYTHPVWRFMDLSAHLAALHADGSRGRDELLQLTEGLIDEMAREPAPDAALYRRALDRLLADDRARFEARLRRAAEAIHAMQTLENRLSGDAQPTGAGPLDEAQLDTVPADLLDNLGAASPPETDPQAWLRQRRPGDWLQMFIQGEWQQAQLLAIGQHADVFLFGRGQGEGSVALRQAALLRLRSEGLARRLRMRSMLRSAAVRLLRDKSGAR